jgi:hypothetical protein
MEMPLKHLCVISRFWKSHTETRNGDLEFHPELETFDENQEHRIWGVFQLSAYLTAFSIFQCS